MRISRVTVYKLILSSSNLNVKSRTKRLANIYEAMQKKGNFCLCIRSFRFMGALSAS